MSKITFDYILKKLRLVDSASEIAYNNPTYTSVQDALDALNNEELLIQHYQVVPRTSSPNQITPPANGSIVLNKFGGSEDAILSTVTDSDDLNWVSPKNAAQEIVTTSLDSNGNYVFSSIPEATTNNNVGIIYFFSTSRIEWDAYKLANPSTWKKYVVAESELGTVTTADVIYPTDGVSTHLTHAQQAINHIWSASSLDGFALTENGNGTVTIADGQAVLRPTNQHDSELKAYYITGGTTGTELTALNDNDQNFIILDYNGGAPIITVATDPTSIDGTTKTPIFLVTRVGNDTHVVDIRNYTTDFPHLQTRKEFFTQGFIHELGGTIITEVGTRNINLTAGAFYLTTSRIPHSAFNTSTSSTFTRLYTADSGATWTRSTAQTTVNNTQYNNIASGLVSLGNNKFKVAWVYIVLNNPDLLYVIEGQAEYANQSEALAAGIPSVLPPEVQANSTGQLVGKIILQEGQTNFIEILSPFTTTFTSSLPTDHNSLGGLQGGTTGEYYHLTASQYSALSSLVPTVRSVSSATTFLTTDYTIKCTSGTFTVNLPSAVGISGKIYVLKNSGVGIITLDAAGIETIDNIQTIQLNPDDAYTVQSDGTNWIII